MVNKYKTSGPEVDCVYATVRCCRDWDVITATLTWDPKTETMKHESWWWRSCGLCHSYPRLVEEEEI